MDSIKRIKKETPCLSVLGTGSDVGKSVVAAALCRHFANKGIRVAPYKSQNMSNNSGVTPEGLEMGRAQIVQAEAAKIPPAVDMNPILLKPTTDVGAQVVVLGKAVENLSAKKYHERKQSLYETATASLDRLRNAYDLIVMEGAGSCAEVNLMPTDIVNFAIAEYADAPVILVADIHRGGVFAQLVGTLEVIPAHLRDRVAGFIINRFRGDIDLFSDGARWITQRTGKPVFGVLPWYTHFSIPNEDSVVIESPAMAPAESQRFPAIGVVRIPHIANFTDIDPLMHIEGLNCYFMEKPQDISAFAAVILPGSKNTRYDLTWLHDSGWSNQLRNYANSGGHVLGICGGYQMLGSAVHDPNGTEAKPGTTLGLDLLPVETVLKAPKTTTLSDFEWAGLSGSGYEIHMGQTQIQGGSDLLNVTARNTQVCDDLDGCLSSDGHVMGTYMHGFFDTPAITRRWLEHIGLSGFKVEGHDGFNKRDKAYDLLAEHLVKHVDVDAIEKLIKNKKG
jgi:adenosylcobyric acid synthase